MLSSYRQLDTEVLDHRKTLTVSEGSPHKRLEDPACEVIVDFYRHKPLRLTTELTVDAAIARLQRTRLQQAMVEDDNGCFCGLVTLADLESRKLLGAGPAGSESAGILDVMVPKSRLKGISYAILEHATIGDLLQTLRVEGTFVLLVLDRDNIRGVVVASELARCLNGDEPAVSERSNRRADVVDVVSGRGWG